MLARSFGSRASSDIDILDGRVLVLHRPVADQILQVVRDDVAKIFNLDVILDWMVDSEEDP